jgi:hypothetical protein
MKNSFEGQQDIDLEIGSGDIPIDQERLEQKVEVIGLDFPEEISNEEITTYYDYINRIKEIEEVISEEDMIKMSQERDVFARSIKKDLKDAAYKIMLFNVLFGNMLNEDMTPKMKSLDLPNGEISEFLDNLIEKYGGA